MAEKPRPQPSSSLTEELGVWKTLGCFVWIALPFLMAIPLWLDGKEAYVEAVQRIAEFLLLGCLLMAIFLLMFQIWQNRGTAMDGVYLLLPLAICLSAMALWNLAAQYTTVGITPLAVGEYAFTAGWGMLLLLAAMLFFWLVGFVLRKAGVFRSEE